ncbi:CvpA family protein, partial [Singulisphaera rosea]
MGLDLALGGLVLISAIRGWFKGFTIQMIRLIGLVACVYAADPIRDLTKPHVLPYLPKIMPELVERGLWWMAAVLSYVILVGLASLAVKLYRRKPFGLEEANRNDQYGGTLLGIAKGVISAAFVVSGIQQYALEPLQKFPWALEQAKMSKALLWNEQYQPVAKVWDSPPVKHFVDHIKRMGLGREPEERPASPVGGQTQTAIRTPKLEMRSPSHVLPDSWGSGSARSKIPRVEIKGLD